MYDVIIGHYGEDKKHLFWGQKLSYRVDNLYTGWRPQALQHIFRFYENFENFGFCDHFSRKSDFLKFLWSKNQNFKNPRQLFCRPCFSMHRLFFVCILLKNSIFCEFSNIYLLSAQNRVKWRHKIGPIANNSGRIWFSLHETTPNRCPERCAKFNVDTVINEEVIPEKPRGGRIRPPRRWRVKTGWGGPKLYGSMGVTFTTCP